MHVALLNLLIEMDRNGLHPSTSGTYPGKVDQLQNLLLGVDFPSDRQWNRWNCLSLHLELFR